MRELVLGRVVVVVLSVWVLILFVLGVVVGWRAMQAKKQRREAAARRRREQQQQGREQRHHHHHRRRPLLLQPRDERCVSCTTFNILAPIYKRMDSEVSWISAPFRWISILN